jgi:hypothetical protein
MIICFYLYYFRGWNDYFWSPEDLVSNITNDQKVLGSLPLLEWYIQQIGEYRKKNGIQLVDDIFNCFQLSWFFDYFQSLMFISTLKEKTLRLKM